METKLEDYDFDIKLGVTAMRKGSLSIAYTSFKKDIKLEPFFKSVFLICGISRRMIKTIICDCNVSVKIIKRLERITSFRCPNTEEKAIKAEISDLLMLLKGYDVWRRFSVLNLRYIS